nr:hypothetical protein [Tanacetum cinerariifolium]
MTTLAEFMIIAGADNRPPMLEKSMYDSSKSQSGTTRTKKYEELSVAEKLQADCDLKATNIILQGLPPDVYAIVNHHKVAKEIWDRVKLLMQGTKLSLQEKECKLYDEFDKFLFVKGLAVLVFTQGDDPIVCLNKAIVFLTTIASLRFPSTNNQLRTSSHPRNQDTIQDDRVIVQQVQGRQGQSYAGTGYKGEGRIARKCTQLKRPRNAAWFMKKAMLAEALESGQILIKEQLAFLVDLDIPNGQATQTTIPNTAAFQTKDLYAYNSDCDDVSNAKAVLMANLSDYGSNIISEENLALKLQIDSLEQNLSNQIKEKESLLQTFTVFKNKSKEKESNYMDKEINLEKKIKELDNIVYKVGQSAQIVHMLTKPQVFYDDTHKQALGYQNLFYLKKAQQIKPTFYVGSVISSQHAASLVIDDEDTLILEEVSRSKMLAKQNDPMLKEKNVNTTSINYVELNRLSEDFGKRFVPQQELSDEQAFWLQTSHPNTDQSASSPVKIKAPKELSKSKQNLCFRQELLEYMTIHDNDASESSKPSWGKMCTSGT